MKVILCTGDSHTWGQGATGQDKFSEEMNPAGIGGTLRLAPFRFPNYVNLFRNWVCEKTGSFAGDIYHENFANLEIHGTVDIDHFVNIRSGSVGFKVRGSLLRVEFQCPPEGAAAEILVDGKTVAGHLELKNPGAVPNSPCTHLDAEGNWYHLELIRLEDDGEHVLEVRQKSGVVRVFRVEYYGGEYAVINCGIGSCPTKRFREYFWDEYVVKYRPEIVVAEGQTINDWLNLTPEQSYESLLSMLEGFKELGARPFLMTVGPIMGTQLNDSGIDFAVYLEQSKRAAEKAGAPVLDANRTMAERLEGLSKGAQFELLFWDNWHLNDEGNRIYFQSIADAMEKYSAL